MPRPWLVSTAGCQAASTAVVACDVASPSAASRPAGPPGRDRRRPLHHAPVEPLVALPPTLLPLAPEEERRVVELLAELLASLLERSAGDSRTHDE
jgi:hypothetical protein